MVLGVNMLFWTGNYLLVCLALLGLASAISVPRQHETLSNAQRVARGLTPNKPTRLYDPTRVRREFNPADRQ